MDIKREIARQVEKLPPETQEQVLRFVASLALPRRRARRAQIRDNFHPLLIP
jgi:hypothetical protein